MPGNSGFRIVAAWQTESKHSESVVPVSYSFGSAQQAANAASSGFEVVDDDNTVRDRAIAALVQQGKIIEIS